MSELLIALSLPVSVLLVGFFTVNLANKKRNDDLFDKRIYLYNKIKAVWNWVEESQMQSNSKLNPFPIWFFGHSTNNIHLPSLGVEASFLFNEEIGWQISKLMNEVIHCTITYEDGTHEIRIKEYDDDNINYELLSDKFHEIKFSEYLILNRQAKDPYLPTFSLWIIRISELMKKEF